jgi:hypothetical protein
MTSFVKFSRMPGRVLPYYGYARAGEKWTAGKLLPDDPGIGPWTGPYVEEKRLV